MAVNLGLNYVLIPTYGIVGAAIATLITEFTVCFLAPMAFSETRMISGIMAEAVALKWLFTSKKRIHNKS